MDHGFLFEYPGRLEADMNHSQAPTARNRDRERSGMSSPLNLVCVKLSAERRDIATPGCRIVQSSAPNWEEIVVSLFE